MKLLEPSVQTERATFGIACFWGSEARYGCVPGVIRTRVGYTGGAKESPDYENLGDHTEVVEVQYDPQVTNYENLLEIFWKSHDPTEQKKNQYMSAIFYHDETQKKLAESTKEAAQKKLTKPIVTKIIPAGTFHDAEDYHQKYVLQQHPLVFDKLGVTGKDLIQSHVAARLNGYLSGNGSVEDFDKEWKQLGITEEIATYCREEIARKAKAKQCGDGVCSH